jgi:hypothetical protein
MAAATRGHRHDLYFLRSIAPAEQNWYQSEYRLTDVRRQVSIRAPAQLQFSELEGA